MWRSMDLERNRERKVAEKKAGSCEKKYYSRHESHYPPYYPHYEGFRGEHGGHHHHSGHQKHGHCHQRHHEHGHHHQEYRGYGQELDKRGGEGPVSVSICIIPRKSKGKFHAPSVYGDYDLERNKVCIQLPDKHDRSGDRMSYHDKTHLKMGQDGCRCSSDGVGREARFMSSSRNGARPHYIGLIGGIHLCGPTSGGNASGRPWRGSCC